MIFRAKAITSLQEMLDIHNIQQLKHRYMRAIDTLDWDLIDTCYADDARVWYMDGAIRQEGRERIVDFFRKNLGEHHYSSHIALHPEISLTSASTAEALWRFQDTVFTTRTDVPDGPSHGLQKGQRAEGAGIYYDEYVKVGPEWLIQSTGFVRLYEYWATPDYGHEKGFGHFRAHGLKLPVTRWQGKVPPDLANS